MLAGLVLVTVNPAFRVGESRTCSGSRAVGILLTESGAATRWGRRSTRRGRSPRAAARTSSSRSGTSSSRRAATAALPDVPATTPRRSSTRRAPPASRRARCCTTAGWPTTRRCSHATRASARATSMLNPMPMFHTGRMRPGRARHASRRARCTSCVARSTPALVLELIETRARHSDARRPDHADRAAGASRRRDARPVEPAARRCRAARSSAPSSSAGSSRRFGVPVLASSTARPSARRCSPRPASTTAPTTRPTTIGRPMPQTEVKIVDPDDRRDVMPLGEVGEICARGYCVMHGYFDEPDATAEAHRRRRLAAHRRPRLDGRARLLPHRRAGSRT